MEWINSFPHGYFKRLQMDESAQDKAAAKSRGLVIVIKMFAGVKLEQIGCFQDFNNRMDSMLVLCYNRNTAKSKMDEGRVWENAFFMRNRQAAI